MSKYAINFPQLINDMLRPTRRKPKRISFINDLLASVRRVYDEFLVLQSKLDYESKVTSQVINLESYLVDLFGPGITITINVVSTADAYVKHEDDDDIGFSVIHEIQESGGAMIGYEDEAASLYNFTINVPAALNADLNQMAAIINKYKVTGSTYQIIES